MSEALKLIRSDLKTLTPDLRQPGYTNINIIIFIYDVLVYH
ncbi:353L [Invertebrate iridescent virus Kaz2018]|uniref:353L n=1 Tax=Invertebrate iridescent virus 6 TaxID=176652 RepID=Q91FH1_IIV6|nr:353L [Invertebrate iridescent virus 6]AAK82214.1 353L [Invertebrate iridescent virus 6]QNH08763.1 353L [Invertebrate iridescent virus Kaz2018]